MTRSVLLVLRVLSGGLVAAPLSLAPTGAELLAQTVTPPPSAQSTPQNSVPVPPEVRATIKRLQPNAIVRDTYEPYTLGPDRKIFHIGDACVRKSDRKPGIIKRDACMRWYCSLPDAKDIIELRPNMATEMGCVWRLVGTHCRCGPTDAAAKSKTP